ncbi:MAG: DHH family phosphoesterase [Clostridiales Family XIII bacterium]|jgi:manganese-dependent inorganic pyrophosphatase|nr:DHH family phosphoesterase [Clostridiales Family XIII bacterium]
MNDTTATTTARYTGRDEWFVEPSGTIAVIGTRDGRADSLFAAIALARLKQQIADRTGSTATYLPCRASELSAASRYALDKFGADAIPSYAELEKRYGFGKLKISMVGHNDLKNAADGISPLQVIEILDRHALGGMRTKRPVNVLIESVGATSSIVWRLYKDCGIEPDRLIASLLAVGIITATAGFTTHTCKEGDRIAAAELASIAGLDLAELTGELAKYRPIQQFEIRESEDSTEPPPEPKKKRHIWR